MWSMWALWEIIHWHRAGTRHGIRADSDGLLHAGEAGTQLTWMDARIGDWVVTSRCGKPVEVQSLWYNALRVQQQFARLAGDGTAEELEAMAEHARTSFNRRFWNEELECLYDVIDGDARDASIRPNQVLALSLTHSMLDPDRGRRMLRVVETHLLTSMGLRTLAPADSSYASHYGGSVRSPDSAYHQGTVWPWLMGPFVRAYMRAYGASDEVRNKVKQWVGSSKGTFERPGWVTSPKWLTRHIRTTPADVSPRHGMSASYCACASKKLVRSLRRVNSCEERFLQTMRKADQ